jgi:putative ABC transport system permease protein
MDWKARVRTACARQGYRLDDDVVEELALHAAAAFEALRADGIRPEEAAREMDALLDAWSRDPGALRRRPRRLAVVEAPAPSSVSLTGVLNDLKYAGRLLRRTPGYAVVAIATMALGIGATTTLFSVAYGVLLKPLPWPLADQLVRVSETRQGHAPRIKGTITNAAYLAWRDRPSTIEGIAGWLNIPATVTVGEGSEPTRLQTASVTPSLFAVLQARPLRGRVFVDDDRQQEGSLPSNDVIVLSYGLWSEWFAGRDDAIGRVVRVGGKPLTVIGVMPRDFVFPDRETRAWTPWVVQPVLGAQGARRIVIFSALARLRPGVTPAQAAAEGTARARTAPDPGLAAVSMFGGNGPAQIQATPAIEMMTADVRPALLVLLAAGVLLLATATANVASLQLARATTRRREMAVRAALGAGAARLTRQLFVESGLLGFAGGAAGLGLAAALHRALPLVLPPDFPRADAVAIDLRVLLFALAASVAVTLACGILPALRVGRVDLARSLAEDSGSAPVGGALHSPVARARLLIMGGQIAIACMLMVGAVLLARSFVALLHADRGYDPTNVLTARVPFPSDAPMARRAALLEGLTARLRALPGVRAAAFGNALPLLTSGGFSAFRMRPPNNPSVEVEVNTIQRVVDPAFFSTLGLRIVAGRPLADTDTMTSQEVIVVNRSFAAKYLGDRPLGAEVPSLHMCREDSDRWQVVGVVDDMRQGGVGEPPQPELFMPFRQIACAMAVPNPILVVRTAGDPLQYAAALRALLRELDPSLALESVMTMEERVMTSLARPRLYAAVLGAFCVFAVAIAGVGLFGVLSYSVAQRTREIGVRTALGATPADIVRLVLNQALLMTAVGIGVGVWGSFALTKYLSAFLYGVTRHDLPTFAAVAIVLVAVTAAACAAPARRAARIDPLRALRGS